MFNVLFNVNLHTAIMAIYDQCTLQYSGITYPQVHVVCHGSKTFICAAPTDFKVLYVCPTKSKDNVFYYMKHAAIFIIEKAVLKHL